MNTIAASEGTNIAPLLLSALAIGLLFFFMIVRPQKRNLTRHNEMLASLKVGDDIITSGGLYGQIVSVEDDAAQIEIAKDVVVKVALRSIAMKKAILQEPQSDAILEEK